MNIESFVLGLAVIGGAVYGLVELFKPVWDESKRENVGDTIVAAIAGVVLCLATGLDVFAATGVPFQVPFLGAGVTGILMGVSGGRVIHDIIGIIPRAPKPPGVV